MSGRIVGLGKGQGYRSGWVGGNVQIVGRCLTCERERCGWGEGARVTGRLRGKGARGVQGMEGCSRRTEEGVRGKLLE